MKVCCLTIMMNNRHPTPFTKSIWQSFVALLFFALDLSLCRRDTACCAWLEPILCEMSNIWFNLVRRHLGTLGVPRNHWPHGAIWPCSWLRQAGPYCINGHFPAPNLLSTVLCHEKGIKQQGRECADRCSFRVYTSLREPLSTWHYPSGSVFRQPFCVPSARFLFRAIEQSASQAQMQAIPQCRLAQKSIEQLEMALGVIVASRLLLFITMRALNQLSWIRSCTVLNVDLKHRINDKHGQVLDAR